MTTKQSSDPLPLLNLNLFGISESKEDFLGGKISLPPKIKEGEQKAVT